MNTILLLASLLAGPFDDVVCVDYVDGGGVCRGDLDLNGHDLVCVGDIALDSISPDATNVSVTLGAGTLGIGDGTYSWGHSPQLGVEGALEVDGMLYCDGGMTLGADADAGGYDVTNLNAIDQSTLSADTAPRAIVVTSQDAWAQATVNAAGADITLAPGLGRRYVTISDKANSAGDTITLTVNGTATVLTAGTSFQCAALADNPACAAALAAATMPTGITAACAAVGCPASTVYVTAANETVHTFTIAIADAGGGGALGAATAGTDGQTRILDGTYLLPSLAFANDTDTGFYRSTANNFYFTAGGSTSMQLLSSGLVKVQNIRALATGSVGLMGAVADGATAIGLKFAAENTLSTSGAKIAAFYNDAATTEKAWVTKDGLYAGYGGIAASTAKGALTRIVPGTAASVTFAADPGDASKTATGLRTAKRLIVGVSGRVTTAGTNCASIKIGDGVDDDRYGAAIAVAAGTVFDIDDATADPHEWLAAAGDVVVTANGGNCFGLVVALTPHYVDYQAATTD